jgi:hypothetical protein
MAELGPALDVARIGLDLGVELGDARVERGNLRGRAVRLTLALGEGLVGHHRRAEIDVER